MQDNLNIEVKLQDKTAVLELSGRLDANWAGHLNDNIEKIIRSGIYEVILDTSGIQYISSAGIRILVKQYKNLQSIGGELSINRFSEQVEEVLNMVGMVPMFSAKKEKDSPDAKLSTEAFTANGYRFMHTFSGNQYGVGLGAIGTDFEDCKTRFGEFLALGDAVAYLPSSGNGIPDYTLRTGQLIPKIESLYAILMEGEFSTRYRFISDGDARSIGLSELMKSVHKHQIRDTVAFLMIAESGGLVGTTLNTSPVSGEDPFTFPQIRDKIHFTTEPAHQRMLTVSTGVITSATNEKLSPYIRPLGVDSGLSGHIHTAVFPYQMLKKRDLHMKETIHMLLTESEIRDILHLTNDTREIQGLGESQFIQGYLWCSAATL